MKQCICNFCYNPAVYKSNNSPIKLCEDCYISMSDDFESSMESSTGIPFDEYYEIEEIED
mgnify:CR=1 FL=1